MVSVIVDHSDHQAPSTESHNQLLILRLLINIALNHR